MRDKTTNIQMAMEGIADGATVMIGGFIGCGSPHALIEALLDCGARDLTIIGNDSGRPDYGIGRLIHNRRVKKLIASHIGTNPETIGLITAGELEAELVPQGTFVERIRAGGAGLGGVITPTGVGTLVEQGKRKIELEGREYLIELPLRADVALVWAHSCDTYGNAKSRGSARNTNMTMACAAKLTILEVENLTAVGGIDPESVDIPGVYVQRVVEVKA